MNEPTVLDYLKSILNKNKRNSLIAYLKPSDNQDEVIFSSKNTGYQNRKGSRQYLVSGLIFALVGQYLLEPPPRNISLTIVFYITAIIFFWLSLKNFNQKPIKNSRRGNLNEADLKINGTLITLSIIILFLAFLYFENNQFTCLNCLFWIVGIALFIISVWQHDEKETSKFPSSVNFYLIIILVSVVCIFYRFYLLDQVPGEMFSDHAEKLLDVMDIFSGKKLIFFIRNTGREALQFYLTAAIIKIFNTGISFISLKLGTAFLGLITLPFLYLLARQIYNKWVAIIAVFFSGIAYWPNVISRVGLRFPLYPLFTAISLYFLFKGLEEKKSNQLLLSGLLLGLGLHGYSPFRIVPILVLVIVAIFVFKEKSQKNRIFAINGFFLIAVSAFIVFLPLFKFILENPECFNARALSRLTSVESPINGSIILIFLNNFWKSLIMFFYRDGVVWVNSIPNRPALDIVSAVFLVFGFLVLMKRIFKEKTWQDIGILFSIPILMLPSILSLAFPQENPALNRSGGVIIIVFIITGLGFYTFLKILFYDLNTILQKLTGSFLIVSLMAITLLQNYNLVFSQYDDQFLANAWNTSEIGNEISKFVLKGNSPDNAFVVPYPYWVDTRLVGINAGYPQKDYALWPENFDSTLKLKGDFIFIVKPEDRNSLNKLKLLYPKAEEEFFYSKTPGKNFIIVSVES